MRQPALRCTLAATLCALASVACPAAPVATVRIRAGSPAGPATFGQVFVKGAVWQGAVATAGGRALAAQMDVKRRYDDGSVRFAIISVPAGQLGPGADTDVALAAGKMEAGPPVTLKSLLATPFDAEVALTSPDGAIRRASARKLLSAGTPSTWLQGPVVTEWLVSGPPVDASGKPDPDLNVQFQVRAYAGLKHVRVSVVVENCWDTWAGNIAYDAAVRVGGKPVFAQAGLDHGRLSRWRKTFWWGEPVEESVRYPDPAGLAAVGALPNYDLSVRPTAAGIEDTLATWQRAPRAPLEPGILNLYMPTTGGRPEIAPYPVWTARYLLSGDARLREVVLGQGDLAGSWPIHVRARRTGRIMTLVERPKFWLDDRGEDRPTWQPDRTPRRASSPAYVPDVAHQGSFAYLPYLLTGDYYYLEESAFWASYCLLAQWPSPRQDGRGLMSDQIRGNAWGLRNIGDAEWIALDGSPEQSYFAAMLRNNLEAFTTRMYGPPEHSATGVWGERTVEDARIHDAANARWLLTPPWEDDYLLWSMHHLVELGHPDATKPRDYLLRMRVGLFTHAPACDPLLGAPYRLVVGETGSDGKPRFYDWAQLGAENLKLTKPGLIEGANGYTYSARAALVCGVDAGFAGAANALVWLDAQLPDRAKVLAAEPFWALAPGGGAARKP